MRILSRFLIVTFIFLSGGLAHAQAGSEPIVATDLLRIRQLGDVAVSPDGRSVAYTVRSIVETESEGEGYEYRTQLWVASGREAPRQLTFARDGASAPAWHPDGDRLAFVRPVAGTPQVFILSMYGGEAQQVTDFEHGASAPQWSPDGESLLFASSLPEQTMRDEYGDPPWPSERPGSAEPAAGADPDPDGSIAEIRAWLAESEARDAPRVIDRLDFQGERGLEHRLTFDHYYVATQDTLGAWSDPRSITPVWGAFSSAHWHPDGQRVLLGGIEYGGIHPDRERRGDIFITYIDQPRPRRLFSLADRAVGEPRVSPDGQTVAFVARDLLDPGFAQTAAGIFAIDDPSQSRILTEAFDRSVSQIRWSPDNWHLYFVAPSEGTFPLYRVRVFDEPEQMVEADTLAAEPDEVQHSLIERVTDGTSGVGSYDLSRATIYYVLTRPENPYELYASTVPFEQEQRLTDHHSSWLASKRLSRPEHFEIENDGFTIDYWVMRPAPFSDGRPYPMLLQIHGGPAAMWGPGEASMWHEFQFFAARGYVVVFANPRGSGGYGYEFQRANFQDWGAGPASDVIAVADAAARLPFVDVSRQVVTGGSYAGYLTAWIIARDDRFRAAVAQRGVYDLPTFLGEGNAWRLVPSHFGGYPWEDDPLIPPPDGDVWRPSAAVEDRFVDAAADSVEALLPTPSPADTAVVDAAEELEEPARSFRDILIENSPLSFAQHIETPLLIIHGDQDLRTGVIQSEMLYRTLKLLERPVEYARYPGADHELSRSGDPRLRLDRLLRIYEFMERWVE